MSSDFEQANLKEPQCFKCKHLEEDNGEYFCGAYPDIIPDRILKNEIEHNKILKDQVFGAVFNGYMEIPQEDLPGPLIYKRGSMLNYDLYEILTEKEFNRLATKKYSCINCAHWWLRCSAFPFELGDIPSEFWNGDTPHLTLHPDQLGTKTFKPREGGCIRTNSEQDKS